MKETLKKVSGVCKIIFGYGIMVSLFVGGMTFFGYLLALVIGGPTAEAICTFIYKQVVPVMIYVSTVMVLFGIACMYMAGEKALTPEKKKAAATEGEK